MERLDLRRDPSRDFSIEDPDIGLWRGQVWNALREDWTKTSASS